MDLRRPMDRVEDRSGYLRRVIGERAIFAIDANDDRNVGARFFLRHHGEGSQNHQIARVREVRRSAIDANAAAAAWAGERIRAES